jgi:hypothetical protein
MGRWKVQIQLWLTATVINIKRVVRVLSQRGPEAGSQEVTNRAFITGMFADAVRGITHVMRSIFAAYGSTSATILPDHIHIALDTKGEASRHSYGERLCLILIFDGVLG